MKPSKEKLPYALVGLRHLALRVRDISRSRSFYEGILQMNIVWEPDSENLYLSSGMDNLALHQIPQGGHLDFHTGKNQPLDHLGFLVESPEAVHSLYRRMVESEVVILAPPKEHRDGSHSFYMADPDGNSIQILFEPSLSPPGGLRIPQRGQTD